MKKITLSLKLIRPQQWVKNSFIFLPIFFSGKANQIMLLYDCFLAFVIFCLFASSIYVFNDIIDADFDKLHPVKKNRPLASGSLNKAYCYFLSLLLLISGIVIFIFSSLNKDIIIVLLSYYILNIFYTLKLKKIAIVDVVVISCGFLLRLMVGSISSGVILSHWIVIMTFLLSLFLAFAKRRNEYIIYADSGIKSRENIINYNKIFLDSSLTILATITIISYINYTLSPEVVIRSNQNLYLTSLFVVLGLFRYLQQTMVDNITGDPTGVLLKDRFIQFCILCWLAFYVFFLYIKL